MKVKKKSKEYFQTRAMFFLVGMKVQGDQHGGRLLLGDNTFGGAVYRGRSLAIVLEFG